MILAILLTLLQLYDGWTTYQIIEKFGGKETNPVMIKLIEKAGSVYAALVITKGVTIVLAWVLAFGNALIALFILTAAYIWVANNNRKVLRQLKNKQ